MAYPSLLVLIFATILFTVEIDSENIIDFKTFTPDPACNKKFFNFGNLAIRSPKPGVTRLAGTVRLLQDIGKNLTIFSRLFRTDPEDEKAAFYTTVCGYVAERSRMWSVMQVSPKRTGCPLPKGQYSVNGFSIHPSQFDYLPTKAYRVETEILRNDVKICAANLTFNIVPNV